MQAQWYYLDGDQQVGPVDRSDLLGLLERGDLSPDTQVWQEGMPDWLPAVGASALGYVQRPRVRAGRPSTSAPKGRDVRRVVLPGPLVQYRPFLAEELPQLIYETHVANALGGQTKLKIQEKLGLDRLNRCKVITDTAESFEASVFIGKTSRSFIVGFRRISIRANESEGRTLVDLFETKKLGWIVGAVGCLGCFFVVPAVVAVVVNVMNTSYNSKVIAQVAAAIKARHPNAVFALTGGK